MPKIKIMDAICSSGKTTSLINYINETNEDTKFLYITPFLTEVDRIIKCCPSKRFCQPKIMGTKLNGIKNLFKSGKNIVSTHSLFHQFNQEIIELAYLNNYTLVMDEVANVIEPVNISQKDLEDILRNYIKIEESGKLIWEDREYTGEFDKYKRLCDLGCLYIYNNAVFLWMFPVTIFEAFKEIYILTYMFEAQMQCYYYKYYNINFEYIYTKDFHITKEKQTYDINKYKKLINIYDNEKANCIGDLNYTLSVNWYKKNVDIIDDKIYPRELLKELKKKTTTYFKYCNTSSSNNMFTTYKSYESIIKGNGYNRSFIPLNSRATNDYRNKNSCAYLCNVYFNPYIKNFFKEKNIEIDEDQYALSELIQWIFRSAIREEKKINLYIPSKRMRNLLQNWK